MLPWSIEHYYTIKETNALLGEFWSEKEIWWAHYDYNLFDLEKRPAHRKSQIIRKFEDDHGGSDKTWVHYFLRYTEGSYTRIHNDKTTEMTYVTLLESSPNLDGGYAIINEVYGEEENKYNKGYRKATKEPYNKPQVPVVVSLKKNETLVYDKDVYHSVSKVLKGQRIVLISWRRD